MHIIAGIMLIGGGLLFIINKASLGGIIVAIGILIEAIRIWLK